MTIEQRSTLQNEIGEVEDQWSAVATRWASISPLRGNERFDAQQVNAEVSHKVVMRFPRGLAPQPSPHMRLRFQSRIFDINSIINVSERKHRVEMMCTEVSA